MRIPCSLQHALPVCFMPVSAAGPDYSWPHTGLLCMARLKDDTHKSESSKDDTHNQEVYRIIETYPFRFTFQLHCPKGAAALSVASFKYMNDIHTYIYIYIDIRYTRRALGS